MPTRVLGSRTCSVLCCLGLGWSAVACGGEEGDGEDGFKNAVATVSAALLRQGDASVLDVREPDEHEQGHIPGAVSFDAASLRATIDGVEGQVADPSAGAVALSAAGLQLDDDVVITGQDNGTDPARVAWTLRYYGHTGDVLLLDGGMRAYEDAGLDLETGRNDPAPANYAIDGLRDALRVDQAWVLDHLDDDDVALFDVRTPEEFSEGRIPGATNVNWLDNLDAQGLFRSDAQVRALHGEPTEPTLVVYCRTGSRAAVSWALLRRAGYEDVRLYDGSWAQWGADPDTPKE